MGRPLTAEQVAECHDDPFLWHIQDFDAVDVYVRAVEAERDALRERVERLEEYVRRRWHSPHCDYGMTTTGAIRGCTCGYTDALDEADSR